jgi:hypothetical protein
MTIPVSSKYTVILLFKVRIEKLQTGSEAGYSKECFHVSESQVLFKNRWLIIIYNVNGHPQ